MLYCHIAKKFSNFQLLARKCSFCCFFGYIETFNALMKVAVVSSDEDMSGTELALGLIRDMIASGLGKLQSLFVLLTHTVMFLNN